MDGGTELEPINEHAAHLLAASRGARMGLDDYAALTLAHGPTNAAAVWLRAAWLWAQGLEA